MDASPLCQADARPAPGQMRAANMGRCGLE